MAIPPKTSPDSSASAGRPCIGTWVTTPQRESWRPRWSAHVTAVVEVAWPTTSARPARPYTVTAIGNAAAVADRVIAVKPGPRGAKLHSIAYPCAECGLPVSTRAERHLSCPADVKEALL